MRAEPINPVSIMSMSLNAIEYAPLASISTKAPKIVGILNKKANFEVSLRFNPIINAPVIAIPDLEAPGKTANAWKQPMIKAANKVNSLKDLDWLENLKTPYNKQAKTRFAQAIESIFEDLDSTPSDASNPMTTMGKVAIRRFSPREKSSLFLYDVNGFHAWSNP